jgi:glutamine amidotransferase
MQLFAKKSEEGKLKGLGWIEAEVIKFKFGRETNLKIPHMGWNNIIIKKKDNLFNGLEEESKFYFVHSYHLVCEKEEDVLATTNYGYDFPSVVKKNNILGVQFHPEKSHKYGMKLLENFIKFN